MLAGPVREPAQVADAADAAVAAVGPARQPTPVAAAPARALAQVPEDAMVATRVAVVVTVAILVAVVVMVVMVVKAVAVAAAKTEGGPQFRTHEERPLPSQSGLSDDAA
jgi:hypothetical protein